MVNPGFASMTGFASRRGAGAGFDWVWEVRSVNGKGLDLRMRLPDWVDGLEAATRAAVAERVRRGSVTVSLKLDRAPVSEGLRVNPEALDRALVALRSVGERAGAIGIDLAAPTAAEILGLRGVADLSGDIEDSAPLLAALVADLAPLLDDFARMRLAEGRALAAVISDQIATIAALTGAARAAVETRKDEIGRRLAENLQRVLGTASEADPQRVAQELALLVVKADVTEELDRLGAHVAAARGLLAEDGAVGRKFDFLMQEFMREANTLCSKSGNADLTRIGLDLKTVIDQMREQVQNVE